MVKPLLKMVIGPGLLFWLTVVLEMFPSNLDRTSVSQKSFGKTLQTRWLAFGDLQFDALRSAPIRLDFK